MHCHQAHKQQQALMYGSPAAVGEKTGPAHCVRWPGSTFSLSGSLSCSLKRTFLLGLRVTLLYAEHVQGRIAEATSLARRHCHAPHFSRSLEWLLFTSLEFNADDMPSPAKSAPAPGLSPKHSPERPRRGATAGSLLLAAAKLIRNFPQVLLT